MVNDLFDLQFSKINSCALSKIIASNALVNSIHLEFYFIAGLLYDFFNSRFTKANLRKKLLRAIFI